MQTRDRRIYLDHRERATNLTYVEERVMAKWEPFVEMVNAALAQPRLRGPAPKAGNTTWDVVQRHYMSMVFISGWVLPVSATPVTVYRYTPYGIPVR